MLNGIVYFTDRHPKLSCAALFMMITAIPMLFTYCNNIWLGGSFPIGRVIFVLMFALQLILCFKVERFSLTMMPFIVSLFGVLACEWLYVSTVAVSQITLGPVSFMNTLLSLGVAVFGPESAAAVGGLMTYAVVSFIKAMFR